MTTPMIPELEYAMSVHLDLDQRYRTPVASDGLMYGQVTITGGTFEGPRVRGRVLPGGGDNPTIRPDGVTEFSASYILESEDGTLIRLTNRGLRVSSQAIDDALMRNEVVSRENYYLRVTPLFAVPAGPHEWLARHVFIGVGRRLPTGNIIDYFMVK